MAIETVVAPIPQSPTKKVWVVIEAAWLGHQCGVKPTGEVRVVLGKVHLEASIPDTPATAAIAPGCLVAATGYSVFVPQGLSVIDK